MGHKYLIEIINIILIHTDVCIKIHIDEFKWKKNRENWPNKNVCYIVLRPRRRNACQIGLLHDGITQ